MCLKHRPKFPLCSGFAGASLPCCSKWGSCCAGASQSTIAVSNLNHLTFLQRFLQLTYSNMKHHPPKSVHSISSLRDNLPTELTEENVEVFSLQKNTTSYIALLPEVMKRPTT